MCPANLHWSRRPSVVSIDRPQKCAQWVLSLGDIWQEDSLMPDRPSQCIVVDWVEGCWALIMRMIFSSELRTNESLRSFTCNDRWLEAAHHSARSDQNHSWVRNLSAALHCTGMECVEGFPPGQVCKSQAPYHPSHTAVDCCYDPACACKATTSDVGYCCSSDFPVLSPSGQTTASASLLSQYVTVPVPEGIREVDVLGFSAGSYTGLVIHEVLNEFACG